MTRALSDALLDLAYRGYVLSLQLRGDELWCSSCELAVAPEDLVVEDRLDVIALGPDPYGTLLGLYCPRLGFRATWFVATGAKREAGVLALLRQRDAA